MSKESKIISAIVASTVVVCIVIILFIVFASKSPIKTEITFEGAETKKLDVKISDIYPGSKTEYVVKLKDAQKLYLSLDFERKDISVLENYIQVEIKCKELSIKKPLKELFETKEEIEIGNNVNEIKIIYSVPLSAGNEIQDAKLDFDINIHARRGEQPNE